MNEFNEKGLKVGFQTLFGDESSDVIFSEKKEYRIPAYQRPYSWGEKEVTKLFDDIVESYENNDKVLFLSTIQLAKNENCYDIIDGQQRLTTLFLILLKLNENNNEGINLNVNFDIGEPNKKYFNSKNIRFLNEVINECNDRNDLANNLYAENYDIISNYVENINKEKRK